MQNLDTLINNWIINDTTHSNKNIGTLTNVVSATAGTAAAVFLGKDTTETGAAGENIYANPKNLPTAIASIMSHTQKKINFFPGHITSEEISTKFSDYIKELQSTPFFHLEKYADHKQKVYTKDYEKLIDQLSSIYDGLQSSEVQKIKESIVAMAKSVFGQSKSELWDNLFSQTTIDLSDPIYPKIRVYFTTLHMIHEENGKCEVSEQEYIVETMQFKVLSPLIQANASKLVELDKTQIDTWMSASSSKHNTAVRLCFMND
ncbi:TPA: hypothetical protein MM852_003615 [Salmonella enterica subsp. enterica]|nr:hypothetical protein [Salmonella enterica subsp. enterica serovar Veneziana]HBZ8586312.1 hypothetical protein [Salmonella enterica subsp. enterica]